MPVLLLELSQHHDCFQWWNLLKTFGAEVLQLENCESKLQKYINCLPFVMRDGHFSAFLSAGYIVQAGF